MSSGFAKGYWGRRRARTAARSIKTLSDMERFFANGNWTQDVYHRLSGEKCLVGAMVAMRPWLQLDDAEYWLQLSIDERTGCSGMSIEWFNDSRRTYTEIAEVLARAKQLAAAHAQASPVAELLPPPSRPALTYQPQEDRSVVKLTMADLERVAVKRRE